MGAIRNNPVTSIFGVIVLVFAGIGMLMGKCSWAEFFLLVSSIGAGLGLLFTKDGKEKGEPQ